MFSTIQLLKHSQTCSGYTASWTQLTLITPPIHLRYVYRSNCGVSRRRAQTPGPRLPWRLNFVWWRIIFVGRQCGTSILSASWRLEFWGGSVIVTKFVHPWWGVKSGPFIFISTLQHTVLLQVATVAFLPHYNSSGAVDHLSCGWTTETQTFVLEHIQKWTW
jgi:hypothetical protein